MQPPVMTGSDFSKGFLYPGMKPGWMSYHPELFHALRERLVPPLPGSTDHRLAAVLLITRLEQRFKQMKGQLVYKLVQPLKTDRKAYKRGQSLVEETGFTAKRLKEKLLPTVSTYFKTKTEFDHQIPMIGDEVFIGEDEYHRPYARYQDRRRKYLVFVRDPQWFHGLEDWLKID